MLQERTWPMYLGYPTRAAAAETLATDPQPVWRTTVARGIIGAPALAENVVAVSLVDRRVGLLDRATGAVIWTRRLQLPLGAGPLITDDRVLVAEQTQGGRVYALRLSNGGTIWAARAGDVGASLALAGDALYAATGEGMVGRLDARSGAWLWRTRVNGAVRGAPLPVPAGLAVATQSDSLYLLDAQTGAVRVRRGTRGTVLAAPALADSLIVIGTSSGRLEGLEATTLATRWTLDLGDMIVGSVAVYGGRVFAMTGRGLLAIVPLSEPFGVRRVNVGLVTRGGPTPAGRGVFITGAGGEIVLVDSMGARLWGARITSPVAEPVLVDARSLVAVSVRGDVVLFR